MSDLNMQQQAAAAAAAGIYGLPNMLQASKMLNPHLAQPGIKRPIPSMTPTDFSNPPIKRLNLLESAAQQAAQQAAAFQQRAHLLQAANLQPANIQNVGLPALNPNGGGALGLNPMGMAGINLLGNKSTSNDSDPGRMPHRLIEKKRRDRINSCINQLRELLPESIKKATNRPLEKAIVLELAIDYIKQLQSEGSKIKESATTPNTEAIQTISKTTLASTYEKGWFDASSQVAQMVKSGQSITEIPMRPSRDNPFLARFINENANKLLQTMMKVEKTSEIRNKRVISTGSEGYDSDETGRKTSSNTSKDCDIQVKNEVKEQNDKKKTDETCPKVKIEANAEEKKPVQAAAKHSLQKSLQVPVQNTIQNQTEIRRQNQVQSQAQNHMQLQVQHQHQNHLMQVQNRQSIQSQQSRPQQIHQNPTQNHIQNPHQNQLHDSVQNIQNSQTHNFQAPNHLQQNLQQIQNQPQSLQTINCQQGSCGGSDKITESSDENSEIDVC